MFAGSSKHLALVKGLIRKKQNESLAARFASSKTSSSMTSSLLSTSTSTSSSSTSSTSSTLSTSSTNKNKFWCDDWYQTSNTMSTLVESIDPEKHQVAHLQVELTHIEYLLEQHKHLMKEVCDEKYKLFCRWPGMGDIERDQVPATLISKAISVTKSIQTRLIKDHRHDQQLCNDKNKPYNVVDVKENGAINPYDNDGFQCLSCKQALPNVYMHCMGCELLKKEDFNVCVRCFRSGYHMVSNEPITHDTIGRSTLDRHQLGVGIHETFPGQFNPDVGHLHGYFLGHGKAGKNCCSQRSCALCKKCYIHHCRCHSVFQSRFRFADTKSLQDRAKEMKEILIQYGNLDLEKKNEIVETNTFIQEASNHNQERALFDLHSKWRRAAIVARRSLFDSMNNAVNKQARVRLCSIQVPRDTRATGLVNGSKNDGSKTNSSSSDMVQVYLEVDNINWARGMLVHRETDVMADGKEVYLRHVSVEWIHCTELLLQIDDHDSFTLHDNKDDIIQFESIEWNRKKVVTEEEKITLKRTREGEGRSKRVGNRKNSNKRNKSDKKKSTTSSN